MSAISTRFIRSGSSYRVTNNESIDLRERVPADFYLLCMTPQGEFYLEIMESFVSPPKLYGSLTGRRDRIMNTFLDRPSSTGILLSGKKGSGKTLLAREISVLGIEKGIPTIVINTPFCGDNFNAFIQSIKQECIIMFDEFEKVYDIEKQEKLLTLLDGTFATKKLFIFTTNTLAGSGRHGFCEYMLDRPGRVYYAINFDSMEEAHVVGYCQDNMKNTQYVNSVVSICKMFDFNFDMLKALVEEMNRYGEAPEDAIDMLNAKGRYSYSDFYDMTVHVKKEDGTLEKFKEMGTQRLDPFSSELAFPNVSDEEVKKHDDDDDFDYDFFTFGVQNLVKTDLNTSTYFYEKDGYMIAIKRKQLESKVTTHSDRYRVISKSL